MDHTTTKVPVPFVVVFPASPCVKQSRVPRFVDANPYCYLRFNSKWFPYRHARPKDATIEVTPIPSTQRTVLEPE